LEAGEGSPAVPDVREILSFATTYTNTEIDGSFEWATIYPGIINGTHELTEYYLESTAFTPGEWKL